MIISLAPGLPSANTRLLAVCFSAHPSNASKASFSSANDVIAVRSGASGIDVCAGLVSEIVAVAGADIWLADIWLADALPKGLAADDTDGDGDGDGVDDTDGRYLSSLTFGMASASAPRNASSTPISACHASWVISCSIVAAGWFGIKNPSTSGMRRILAEN